MAGALVIHQDDIETRRHQNGFIKRLYFTEYRDGTFDMAIYIVIDQSIV